jgi:hypothetical protein
LEGSADSQSTDFVRLAGGDLPAGEKDPAAGGPASPGNHIEKRCLAGAVGSYQTNDFTLIDSEIDVFQGPELPELFTESFQLQESQGMPSRPRLRQCTEIPVFFDSPEYLSTQVGIVKKYNTFAP